MASTIRKMAFGMHEDANRSHRRVMEDAHSCFLDFGGASNQAFFAVYDGHAGSDAAKWCAKHLPTTFLKFLHELDDPVSPELLQRAMHRTYLEVDMEIAEAAIRSGCTSVTCFLTPILSENEHLLVTANAGDARAVLCRGGNSIRLSRDHKCDDPVEERRVSDAGGLIFNNRVSGSLAVSRSLGDKAMKKYVIGAPYTTSIKTVPEDEFIIIACDGIWDVMSDQEAIDEIRDIQDAQIAAETLVKRALDLKSIDNLSAIVVRFVRSDDDDLTPTPSRPGSCKSFC